MISNFKLLLRNYLGGAVGYSTLRCGKTNPLSVTLSIQDCIPIPVSPERKTRPRDYIFFPAQLNLA